MQHSVLYSMQHAFMSDQQGIQVAQCMAVKEGKLISLAESSSQPPYALQGLVTPGYIDIQLNGANGALFNRDLSLESLTLMQEGNYRHGTTTFLPTLITSSDSSIFEACEVVKKALAQPEVYPSVKGLHLEGPYISLKRHGVHNRSLVRALDESMLQYLCQKAEQRVLTLITVAPENVTPDQVKSLVAAGALVSIGHTEAKATEIQQLVNAGASLVTHLYNAMPPLVNRTPTLVSEAFLNFKLSGSIIVDGIHVLQDMLQIAANQMQERLFLVTDATATEDAKETSLIFEGERVFVKDSAIRTRSGTLAGALLTMEAAVQRTAQWLSLEQALAMSSEYVAQACKWRNLGTLEIGKQADFVVLHPTTLKVQETWKAGIKVYDHQQNHMRVKE